MPQGPGGILTIGLHPLEALLAYAARAIPKVGFRDIVVHASKGGEFVAWMGGRWQALSVEALGDYILAAGIKGNVRLVSCWAGKTGLGTALADYLKGKGWKGKVEAPTKPGWIDSKGNVGVDAGGKWVH